ncbi:RNase adapter RapZ [Croceibacterium sp. TMG7-5b_MA50]|uniref:RNase adapter RapZ n=1 Tax=Croceibacterium sp. TMG7-5b_MA50 TaxID=3121290 RepID=UPI003221E4A0
MATDSPVRSRRILLLTGMLGAGKTTALRELEDLGWEAIDNFPVRLLDRLLDSPAPPQDEEEALAIGFDSRTRGFVPAEVIARAAAIGDRPGLALTSLFLDCGAAELERRFNETRRRHPLAQERPVADAIAAERELLAPLHAWADMLIDTTALNSNELQQRIRESFGATAPQGMAVTITSFGFSRGMPPVADLVFDMRFLDNPHWVPGLREQTGLDPAVGEHIRNDPGFAPNLQRILDLLADLVPRYAARGKSHLAIAIGCTGGKHRSVFTAERIAEGLRRRGFSPTVLHRNLALRSAALPERPDGA